ncbi:MFS transporter [Bosea sp. (in: a-proteobacteria)]|uniref:MFS transporter n=1 Tax=Bosea sp. (in: a-proteobacteria) TaxID=1871050 RepID=UPI002616CFA9|nr:MFS transporter [Bosea sp. (in: a-proteobacteria)]MCO5091314.1 MFS transporter [Bosea sp. (in: a-proteobacteria)]
MNASPRPSMFAAFAVRNFRFQWGADLLTSWAFEMETIILGWYIFTETGSVFLLTLFASLQFFGTLIAPVFGLLGDRAGYRNVLCLMRVVYALLAGVLAVLSVLGALSPVVVLVVAGLAGMVRPSDIALRNVLIGEILPHERLMGAIGLARITTDSARTAGALVGAGAVHAVGMGSAYGLVVAFYLSSAGLMFGVRLARGARLASGTSPWRDMADAARSVRDAPPQLAAMLLAFLVNFTAYPFTLGLLPYLAREIYKTGETGLGYLSASVGLGAMTASLLLSKLGSAVWPARMMLIFSIVWHLLVIALGWAPHFTAGSAFLVLNGAASMLCLLPMAVLLLRGAPPALRGRIMGIRAQAVYGLPLGLLLSGPLIEHVGFRATATIYGLLGTVCTLMILMRWRTHLWPAGAASNRG